MSSHQIIFIILAWRHKYYHHSFSSLPVHPLPHKSHLIRDTAPRGTNQKSRPRPKEEQLYRRSTAFCILCCWVLVPSSVYLSRFFQLKQVCHLHVRVWSTLLQRCRIPGTILSPKWASNNVLQATINYMQFVGRTMQNVYNSMQKKIKLG